MPATIALPAPGCTAPRRPLAGLTLIELLIGLVMFGILVAQAMPSFSGWVARQRLAGQAGSLGTAMSYAKTEAITRGVRVTVCASAAPTAASPACSSSSAWTDGWLVFVDNVQRAGNTAGVVDAEDTVLRIGAPLAGATASADTAVRSWVAFTPDGLSVGSGGVSNGAISLCLRGQSRSVRFTSTGLVTTATGSC